MKPMIIFVPDSDEFIMSKSDFEKYIEQAYDQGFVDGKKQPYVTYREFNTPPSTPSNPQSPWTITCKTVDDILKGGTKYEGPYA